MRATAPSYYPLFHCIAGDCKHTCCADWEVDIDPETYDRYMNMTGAFAERIRSSIVTEDDGSAAGESHFVLRKDGRCPMLRDDGLCDLILELGESSLCKVCTEHPRFFNFRSNTIECGLGLSCEAALSLILNWQKGFELIDITDISPMGAEFMSAPEDEPDELEEEVYMARDNAISAASDRSIPLSERVRRLAGDLWTSEERTAVFRSLESLSSAWVKYLEDVDPSMCNDDSFRFIDHPDRSLLFENLLVYFLFRYPWEGSRLACELLMMTADCCVSSQDADIFDIVREFSSNVEYSDCNIDDIMSRM